MGGSRLKDPKMGGKEMIIPPEPLPRKTHHAQGKNVPRFNPIVVRRAIQLSLAGYPGTVIAQLLNVPQRVVSLWIVDSPYMGKKVRPIYEEEVARYHAQTADIVSDNYADLALRKAVLARKGVLALDKTIDAGIQHLDDNGPNSRATMLRTLVEAAVAVLDRDPMTQRLESEMRKVEKAAEPVKENTTFLIQGDKINILQATVSECGFDLSHLLKPRVTAPQMIEGEIEGEVVEDDAP